MVSVAVGCNAGFKAFFFLFVFFSHKMGTVSNYSCPWEAEAVNKLGHGC
jgi:hypothetical protein